MPKILPRKFYSRSTIKVARELLGKFLVYKTKKGKISGKIVETEAYVGFDDKASHASKGFTPRTALMYDGPGHWYIYLIYGFYYCLNIVTEKKDYPAAVLIRAIEPAQGVKIMERNRQDKNGKSRDFKNLVSGPGKLCQALGLDKKLNGAKAFGKNAVLYIEDREIKISPQNIASAKRVGVDYAGEWKDKKWRFYIKDNPFVSKI